MQRVPKILMVAMMAAGMCAIAGTAAAQTSVATTEAQAFLGGWDLPIEAGQPVTLAIDIADDAGQVAATVGVQGTTSTVTEISKSGENLVLRYPFDMGGQEMTINIRLTPADEGLEAVVDVGDGMFTAAGTATKR